MTGGGSSVRDPSSWLGRFCSSAARVKTIHGTSAYSASTSLVGEGGLVRRLGALDLILLGIGASIGAGIFVVTGTVARDAGPGVTISFVLAGAACVLNALCYASTTASQHNVLPFYRVVEAALLMLSYSLLSMYKSSLLYTR